MKVTEKQIDEIVKQSTIQFVKLGQKTTVVHVILPNGFEVIESSACVDVSEYNQEIGEKIALERVKNKIWLLEGYLLQNDIYRATT